MSASPNAQFLEKEIIRHLADHLDETSSVTPASRFTDLGLDSLAAVQIGIKLKNERGIAFTVDMVEGDPPISEIARRLADQGAES